MLKTVSSITNAIGALNYKGTWDASTNTPTLVSSTGTKGDYYLVSVAGSTTLNGISVESMRINSARNSGLGVIPEAGWDASWRAFQIGFSGAFSSHTGVNAISLSSNQVQGALPVYIKTAAATKYEQFVGEHRWSTAPSGTAGTTITYVQGMTLDASNNLTIVGATATKASGTTWANPSDVRLKDNIASYVGGLNELVQIQVKTWEYNGKGGTQAGTKGIGVIADEAMLVIPNSVDTYSAKLNPDDEQNTDIKRFDATEITWLLVNAVKELKAEFDAYKASHP
jgi:hypothetical protein